MTDKARGVLIGAAGTVLVTLLSGAATVDQALVRGRGRWLARWLP